MTSAVCCRWILSLNPFTGCLYLIQSFSSSNFIKSYHEAFHEILFNESFHWILSLNPSIESFHWILSLDALIESLAFHCIIALNLFIESFHWILRFSLESPWPSDLCRSLLSVSLHLGFPSVSVAWWPLPFAAVWRCSARFSSGFPRFFLVSVAWWPLPSTAVWRCSARFSSGFA